MIFDALFVQYGDYIIQLNGCIDITIERLYNKRASFDCRQTFVCQTEGRDSFGKCYKSHAVFARLKKVTDIKNCIFVGTGVLDGRYGSEKGKFDSWIK